MILVSDTTLTAKAVFVVKNDRGLHTRPSTEIVKCASAYQSEIHLYCRKKEANAKSLLGILMLTAVKGTRIRIEAKGKDADKAVSALLNLAEKQFNIHY